MNYLLIHIFCEMWQRANALNVSLGNYLHWPNLYYHIINLYLVSLYIRLFTYLSVSPTQSIHHEIIEREFSNITLRLLGPLEKGRKVYERCPWLFIGRKRTGLNSWDAFHIIFFCLEMYFHRVQGIQNILKFTRQPGGQSDMVWCYSGLQI